MKSTYSEEEANEILRRAIESLPVKAEMTREQLQSIAAEVGVTPEALRKAEADWESERADKAERRAFVAARRRRFLQHFAVYSFANLILFILADSARGQDGTGPIFFASLFGWGIGLAVHATFALRTSGEGFELRFTRWRIERRARELAEEELRRLSARR